MEPCVLVVRFAAAALVSALALSAAAQSPQNFQELKWGAKKPELVARLGASTKVKECTELRRQFSKSMEFACDSLELSGYEVAGIKFDVSLELDANAKGLTQIDLYFSTQYSEQSNEKIRLKFRELVKLLGEKYGAPKFDSARTVKSITWHQANWGTTDSEIELIGRVSAGDYGSEELKIQYRPKGSSRL